MRASLMKKLRSFGRNDEGVTLVEYGVALILAVAVGATVIGNMGTKVTGQMDKACNAMTGTTTGC